MEKKVPERKVSLRDEDIFYVYDKRINKCIKEECEGIVKYGLVLRVSMTGEETCNCFECNKCHMKYTPYPNYVRLTKTDMLTIYNKDEVDARDRKRAEDALKQAARDKKKQQGRRFTPRKDAEQGTQGRPYERKSYEHKICERKPYERHSYDKGSYDKNSYEKKPYEKKSCEKKTYDKNFYDKKAYGKKSYEGNSYASQSYERKPYSERPRHKSNTGISNAGYKKPYRFESGYQKNHQ